MRVLENPALGVLVREKRGNGRDGCFLQKKEGVKGGKKT